MRNFSLLKALTFSMILCALTSCVSDEAARYYSPERYPSKEPTEVEVLFEAPEKPHEVIADFQARGATIKTMQKKAAEIGADAIVVVLLGGNRSGRDEWASEDRSMTYSRINASALRYKTQ